MPEPKITLITTHEQAAEAIASLDLSRGIAIDTEFVWKKTFYPVPALIQIADEHAIYLVDADCCRGCGPLIRLLNARDTVKLLHAGDQDLRLLNRLTGAKTVNVYDTQLAATFAGMGPQPSLAKTLQELLGVSLSKEEQLSDWVRRPLSPEQISYAASDVAHLHRLHAILNARLAGKAQAAWFEEEGRSRFEHPAFYDESSPTDAWRKIKNPLINRMDAQAITLLAELATIRDRIARKIDITPRFITADDILIDLAIAGPLTPRQLSEIHPGEKFIDRNSRDILDACRKVSSMSSSELLPIMDSDFPSGAEKALIARANEMVDAVATQVNLPSAMLMPRKEIKDLALGLKRQRIKPTLKGWRASVLQSAWDSFQV